MPYTYDYPHPAVTVDAVVFARSADGLEVLLMQRRSAPHEGKWALPGGFVEIDESLDDAARRELAEETGLSGVELKQLHAFGAPERDPRERVISVAYFGMVKKQDHALRAASDAADARWFPVTALPPLAFDHAQIIALALTRTNANGA